jgi:hypothetical protein
MKVDENGTFCCRKYEYNELNCSIPNLWYAAHMGEKKNIYTFQ